MHPKLLVMLFGAGILAGLAGLLLLLISAFVNSESVTLLAAILIAFGSLTIALALLRGQDLARRARY